MAYRRSRTTSVYVDVDIDEFDTEDLVQEVKERGYSVWKGQDIEPHDYKDLEWIWEAVMGNRKADALSALERLIRPKWKSPEDCQKQFDGLKLADAH